MWLVIITGRFSAAVMISLDGTATLQVQGFESRMEHKFESIEIDQLALTDK